MEKQMPAGFESSVYHEPYCTKDGCLYEAVEKKGELRMVKLCDYIPVLRSEITYDDGAEQHKVFEISAVHASGIIMPTVCVTADEMNSMKWLLEKWGALGSFSPRSNTQGKIRHAITLTKPEVTFRTVYHQTGWRKINGAYSYLLPMENSQHTVELHGKLKGYLFPATCSEDDLFYLTAMLEDSFLPQRVMLPLLAVTFLAPLNHFLKAASCEPKFIAAITGKTGTRKSTTAALFCSFFGSFTASSLPMSFHDTANSILANVYYLKDVLTCVDDLHPSGMFGDMEMKNTAQNLSRYYGDRIGRARLNSKAELQPSKPPTGMCLVTAEYIPEISQSGLARYFMIELKEHDVQLDLMTEYQQLAADGVLAGIMHSYVEWLCEIVSHDDVQFIRTLAATFQKQRSQIIAELHRRNLLVHTRVPDTLAHLQIGFDFLLQFLCAKNQIDADAVEKLRLDFAECLLQNAAHSAQLVESENITFQFCEKLKSLLDSGRCYVLHIGQEQENSCKGFIGYENSEHYYLVMDAALSEVKKLAKEMGEHFSIGRNGLIQQLVEDGIIVTKGKRNTTTIRVTNTKQMSVAVFDKAKMHMDET